MRALLLALLLGCADRPLGVDADPPDACHADVVYVRSTDGGSCPGVCPGDKCAICEPGSTQACVEGGDISFYICVTDCSRCP